MRLIWNTGENMQMLFMLCFSPDAENPILDNEKYTMIQKLEDSGLYYFEPKSDGTRGGLGKLENDQVTIPNRRGKDYAQERNVPELEDVARKFPKDTMIDGEIAVLANPHACGHKSECEELFGGCKLGHPCRLLTQSLVRLATADGIAAVFLLDWLSFQP